MQPLGTLGVIAALAVVGAPGGAVAEELGYRDVVVEDQLDARMFGAGLAAFAISYGTSVVIASTSDRDSNQRLYIPLAGPWLALAEREMDCRSVVDQRCADDTTAKIFLVVDGVMQGAGFLGMLDGMLNPTKRLIRQKTTFAGVQIRPATLKGVAAPNSAPGLSFSGSW